MTSKLGKQVAEKALLRFKILITLAGAFKQIPAWCVLASGTFRCSTAPAEAWGAAAAAAPSDQQASGCTPVPGRTAPGPGLTGSVRNGCRRKYKAHRNTHKRNTHEWAHLHVQHRGSKLFHTWTLWKNVCFMHPYTKKHSSQELYYFSGASSVHSVNC